MKRTSETSEQYWRRIKKEIGQDNQVIPWCFTYGWWLQYKAQSND